MLSACRPQPEPLHDLTVAQARSLGQSGLSTQAIVKGYLAYWPYVTGARLVLYATRDDARMRNVPASILVDVPNHAQVDGCVERFVQLRGIVQHSEQNQSPLITELDYIAPLDTDGGSSGFDVACFERLPQRE